MFKNAKNLLELPIDEVKCWLNSFDAVLTDCDGVLWLHTGTIDGAVDAINKLKEINKRVYFVTNNSTKSVDDILASTLKYGFKMERNEIISTSQAAAAYLKNRNFTGKVYVIGSMGIIKELDAAGIEHLAIGPDVLQTPLSDYILNNFHLDKNVGAVIVGFDEHISFPKLMKAASYLDNPDCLFIATNTDERFPEKNHIVPGTGAIVRSVEVCAERKAFVIGKPNPSICESLIREGIIVPERTLMVGDRCNTDILFGKNCGFQTLLVGSGIHKMEDVVEWMKNGTDEEKKLIPDVYLPKLGDLMKFL